MLLFLSKQFQNKQQEFSKKYIQSETIKLNNNN